MRPFRRLAVHVRSPRPEESLLTVPFSAAEGMLRYQGPIYFAGSFRIIRDGASEAKLTATPDAVNPLLRPASPKEPPPGPPIKANPNWDPNFSLNASAKSTSGPTVSDRATHVPTHCPRDAVRSRDRYASFLLGARRRSRPNDVRLFDGK